MTAKGLTYLKWGFFLIFVNINVGRWDLLPGFLGIFFLLKALKSQEMTETERRLCPLLMIWMVDQFLHWGWDFQWIGKPHCCGIKYLYHVYTAWRNRPACGERAAETGRRPALYPDSPDNSLRPGIFGQRVPKRDTYIGIVFGHDCSTGSSAMGIVPN